MRLKKLEEAISESITETLRSYWEVFNKTQEFTEAKFSCLAVAPFIFTTSHNKTFILPTAKHVAEFFKTSYQQVYPKLCEPYTFVYYRVLQLRVEQLTDNMVFVAQDYIQYTTPSATPRYREGMIILMKKSSISNVWQMAGLIELDADKFPQDWLPLSVPSNWRYDGQLAPEKLPINKVPSGLTQSMFALFFILLIRRKKNTWLKHF